MRGVFKTNFLIRFTEATEITNKIVDDLVFMLFQPMFEGFNDYWKTRILEAMNESQLIGYACEQIHSKIEHQHDVSKKAIEFIVSLQHIHSAAKVG